MDLADCLVELLQGGADHSFKGEVVPVKYSSWKDYLTLKDTNSLHKSRICCKEEIKNIGITSWYGDSLSKIWVF